MTREEILREAEHPMDELVKELRDERNKYQTWFDTSDALDDIISDCLQAAEAIESLQAQLAQVTAERDALLLTQEETEKNEPLSEERFEEICEAVHNGWWEEKKRQGVTDHPDMIPYSELSEEVKEYDRVTTRRVLDALGLAYRHKPKEAE